MSPEKAADVLDALYNSDVFRSDQNTFMLYPDKRQTGFLAKNIVPAKQIEQIPVLINMLNRNERSIVTQDVAGNYRFNANLKNSSDLSTQLKKLAPRYADLTKVTTGQIESLYEQIFNHQAFTGRSGGMFGFEGLGCVYWHMVSKLLLAVQENYLQALADDSEPALIKRLGDLYYRVRLGIGFNKTPQEYGAFPCDPYSHTPKHAGAQQPGMTGQVKEEILTRFGELGIVVEQGKAHFAPRLLRKQEFTDLEQTFRYLDIHDQWQQIALPINCIAFTWCQVPVVYELTDGESSLSVLLEEGDVVNSKESELNVTLSHELFNRSGKIKSLRLLVNSSSLFV